MKAAVTPEVIETFSMCIDLCVPFDDYLEGMSAENQALYKQRLKIRDDLEAAERHLYR
jgi:hypothetical protein